MRRFIVCAAALLPWLAHAQISPDSPMVQALRTGYASAPLPQSEGAQLVAREIMEKTGNDGGVTVDFFSLARYETQPRCGRVGFGLYQRSTNTFWGQFGGQVNMCDDGAPPRRQCKGQPDLVAAKAVCEDGSQPVDTTEISDALAKVGAGGSLTSAQFKARFEVGLRKAGRPE